MIKNSYKWLWMSVMVTVPFLGGVRECEGTPPPPEPEYCFADDECGPGAYCNTDECLSPCAEGEICPAVCYGVCEPAPDPERCFSDDECGPGAYCNTDECLSPCAADEVCTAVCAGICEPIPEPPLCLGDTECGDGEHCNTDRCMSPPGDGEEGRLTVCYGICEPAPICPAVLCDLYCEFGFATGESGCETCTCNPPPSTCDTVLCTLFCEDGFATDESGCPICECAPPPPTCDMVLCTLYCEDGFATDESGCPICECAPPPPGASCGGFPGLTCADGEYCDYDDSVPACGAADHLGTCRPRPEACYEIYAPVCGCDGVTYSNDCVAYAAGTDFWNHGTCEGVIPG